MCLTPEKWAARGRALGMTKVEGMSTLALLSGDEVRIIFSQLCNALEPRVAVYLSSVSSFLRAATQALRQQLRTDHEAAAALCPLMGMRSCKELREARKVVWEVKGFFLQLLVANLTRFGRLGAVLPALEHLVLRFERRQCFVQDGLHHLAKGLGAGALPAVTWLQVSGSHVTDVDASALADALGRGAMPRLKSLWLTITAIGDTGLVALAPTLRRLPALEHLSFIGSPFGDEGLAALVAPPPSFFLPQKQEKTQVLKTLAVLDFSHTEITDAGCDALAFALLSGVLPVLETVDVDDTPTSAAARAAVAEALANLIESKYAGYGEYGEYGEYDEYDEYDAYDNDDDDDEFGVCPGCQACAAGDDSTSRPEYVR